MTDPISRLAVLLRWLRDSRDEPPRTFMLVSPPPRPPTLMEQAWARYVDMMLKMQIDSDDHYWQANS